MLKRFIKSILPSPVLERIRPATPEAPIEGSNGRDAELKASVKNFLSDNLILCNVCGSIFKRTGPIHSEFLACPACNSIARDRVVMHTILYEMSRRTGEMHPIFNQSKALKPYRLLECSPRENNFREMILRNTLGKYSTSDFDMSAHRAEIKLDLTDEEDIQPLLNSLDIIVCAHVLEHIPDYRTALKNIARMLAPGGFLVLQVPLLEAQYTRVTWDEFHGDNTRVFHRFGFDLIEDLNQVFSSARVVIGLLEFPITSPEISAQKYKPLAGLQDQCLILGEELISFYGLGSPDLCDAFLAYK